MATNPKTGSEEFGELLRRSRERLGMSRRDLVEATGLSYPYISQLETGYRQPSPTAIQKLADALQLSLDDLFSAMAKGRRDELSVGTERDSSSHWVRNASFAGGGAGGGAGAAGRVARAARSPRAGGAFGRSAAPVPSDSSGGERRRSEFQPEPAPVTLEQHHLEIPVTPEFGVDELVDQFVDLITALPVPLRLETLARLQAEIVQSAIDDGVRDRLDS
jgi:transcriptional regulator with XRE-family HTH domain